MQTVDVDIVHELLHTTLMCVHLTGKLTCLEKSNSTLTWGFRAAYQMPRSSSMYLHHINSQAGKGRALSHIQLIGLLEPASQHIVVDVLGSKVLAEILHIAEHSQLPGQVHAAQKLYM